MKFTCIPAGEFMMGLPESEKDRRGDEPQHQVRITKPFWLGMTEVTQGQYQQVMGQNPSHFKDERRPVEEVSWEDAVEFCRKLSKMEGQTYRLPTEAEWEYACRAGTLTRYCFGDDEASLGEYAWYLGKSGGTTHPVGEKTPNAWGLYDMHGNVSEWCQDWYSRDYYKQGPEADPKGPDKGRMRVSRGGHWVSFGGAEDCRSASRSAGEYENGFTGFRVCLARSPSG